MKYITECGLKTNNEEWKRKQLRIYLQMQIDKGNPGKNFKPFTICEKCIKCPAKKHKTTEEFMNLDTGETYRVKSIYCLAKKEVEP